MRSVPARKRNFLRPTHEAIEAWIKRAGLKSESFLFPRRVHASPHFSTRQ